MGFFKKIVNVFKKNVPDSSPKGKVDSTDVAKVVRTSVFVALASGLSYLLTNISPDVLGNYGPVITLVGTMALDFLNKLVKE